MRFEGAHQSKGLNPLRGIRFYLGILLGCSSLALAFDGSASLIYMCEDIPPSNYLEAGVLKGASVEVLRLMWNAMDVSEQPIKVVPWARGYHSASTDSGRVLFSMSRTAQRDALFRWVGPIFTVKNVLLGMASRPPPFRDSSQNEGPRIGLIRGDVAESILLEKGFDTRNFERVASLEQNFQKLRMGRIDLVAHTENTLRAFIREKRLDPRQFKVYQILSESPNYYAFSRDVPDEWIVRFQKALDGSRRKHEAILSKYGLSR